MERRKATVSLILSSLIVILEAVGLYMAFCELEFTMFRYYTEDSNLLLLIASVVWLFLEGRFLRDGVAIPHWARILKYTATCMTTVTFLVVLTVLAPMTHNLEELLFTKSMLFAHTLCPLLALISFLFFEGKPELSSHSTWIALLPTLLYGAVAVFLNVLRVWYGPYPFLYVYEQPVWLSLVWCVAIIGGAWGVAALLHWVNRSLHREYIY